MGLYSDILSALEAVISGGKIKVTSTDQLPSALGQATMANSLPVVLASNQTNVNVISPSPTGQISGQITVTTAGTEQAGPDIANGGGGFLVKFDPAATGYGYVGNDGANAVSSTTGHILSPGDQIILSNANLNTVYFDVSVSGKSFSWLKV